MSGPLLDLKGVTKRFSTAGKTTIAVENVALSIEEGETLALIGESGSGKTTMARIIARLIAPDAGEVYFEGEDWLALRGRALRRRRAALQMVFQDPLAALNPLATVGRLLADPLRLHRKLSRREIVEATAELLGTVGLSTALMTRVPHQLSGGQRQRVNIARALASRPRLIILDEPTSSLDASIRAQILNLLSDIQKRDGVAYLLIAHDLAAVRAVADRVAVIHRGHIVETGEAQTVLSRPAHRVTQELIEAIPRIGRRSFSLSCRDDDEA